jgi:hypothetical protein
LSCGGQELVAAGLPFFLFINTHDGKTSPEISGPSGLLLIREFRDEALPGDW